MPRTPAARPRLVHLEDRLAPVASIVDYSFGQDGQATLPAFTAVSDTAFAPDGKVILVGYTSSARDADFAVARLTADGQPDPTFGTNGFVVVPFDLLGSKSGGDFPSRAAVMSDGRVVVIGSLEAPKPGVFPFIHRGGVVRLTADGKLDPTFDGDGKAVLDLVPSALWVLPSGGIQLAGGASTVRLTADGQYDSTYGTGGKLTLPVNGSPTGSEIDAAGRTHVLYTRPDLGPYMNRYAARFTADGELDTTFGTGGETFLDFGIEQTSPNSNYPYYGLFLLPDGGSLWETGTRTARGNEYVGSNVYRLGTDGKLDTSFGKDGIAHFLLGGATTLDDGRIVHLVESEVPGGFDTDRVRRLTPAGQPDLTLGPDGTFSVAELGSLPRIIEAVPGGGGKVIAAGSLDPAVASFAARLIPVPQELPTVTDIPDQSLLAGMSGGPFLFTVGDAETPVGQLTVSVSSSTETVLPATSVTFGGVGANRTLSLAPVAGKTGTAVLTLRVRDANGGLATDTIVVQVTNDEPSLSLVPGVNRLPGESPIVIPFTVGDDQTPLDQLTFSFMSSNEVLVPVAGVTVGGAGAGRTLTIVPVAGLTGAATLTVIVRDNAEGETTQELSVRVNAPPTVSAVADFTTTVGQAIGLFPFTIGDSDTSPDFLALEVVSSNLALVPQAGLTLTGTGPDRGLTVTPVAGATGTTTITLTVRDIEGLTATEAFILTINPAGGPPSPGVPVLVGYPQFGAGGATAATLYNPDQSVRYTVEPFPGFAGGVRTAAADFNDDGVADLVVGTGPGRATLVSIRDGKSSDELFAVAPFEAAFTGGVYVAAGDLTGDGVPDLVITPDEGGGPRVRALNGRGFATVADFFGIDDPNFRGGARAAVGDVNGDGVGDLVVAAGFQGGPRVAGYSGPSLTSGPVKVFGDFFAFEQTLRNGVFIAAGDIDGDGFAEVIAGGGPGGGPRVIAFSGKQLLSNAYDVRANFFGGDEANRGSVRVAVKDLDGDARADLVVGAGTGAGSRVTGYLGKSIAPTGTPAANFDFDAFPGFAGGVFVG